MYFSQQPYGFTLTFDEFSRKKFFMSLLVRMGSATHLPFKVTTVRCWNSSLIRQPIDYSIAVIIWWIYNLYEPGYFQKLFVKKSYREMRKQFLFIYLLFEQQRLLGSHVVQSFKVIWISSGTTWIIDPLQSLTWILS